MSSAGEESRETMPVRLSEGLDTRITIPIRATIATMITIYESFIQSSLGIFFYKVYDQLRDIRRNHIALPSRKGHQKHMANFTGPTFFGLWPFFNFHKKEAKGPKV